MTDLEEEQPTQQSGRRDWSEEGDDETSLEGTDELGGIASLVPGAESPERSRAGKGGVNPGGTLLRQGQRDPE